MNIITVKYFKTWDEIKDTVIDRIPSVIRDKVTSNWLLDRIQTYKVYFNRQKEPVRVKAYNKKGELMFSCFLRTDNLKDEKPISRFAYIYRQRNKTDVLKKGTCYHFIESNENGQKSKETIYHGKIKYQTSYYKYNKNGQLVEEVIEPSPKFVERNNFPRKYIYDYDEKVRKISYTHYDVDDSIEYRKRYYYDENDRVVKEEAFSGELYGENLIMSTLYDYRYSNGSNLVEEKRIYEEVEGRRQKKIEYYYEEETNLLVEKIEYIDNNMSSRTLYTYDDKGRLLKEEAFDSKGVNDLRFTYEYNENSQVIKQGNFIRTPDGTPCETYIESEYDEKGRLKAEKYIES